MPVILKEDESSTQNIKTEKGNMQESGIDATLNEQKLNMTSGESPIPKPTQQGKKETD
jgi:hypothetical protein